MKTGTLKIALALAAVWGPLATAETIVVDDQVQVLPTTIDHPARGQTMAAVGKFGAHRPAAQSARSAGLCEIQRVLREDRVIDAVAVVLKVPPAVICPSGKLPRVSPEAGLTAAGTVSFCMSALLRPTLPARALQLRGRRCAGARGLAEAVCADAGRGAAWSRTRANGRLATELRFFAG
jgi:hypothetical protein